MGTVAALVLTSLPSLAQTGELIIEEPLPGEPVDGSLSLWQVLLSGGPVMYPLAALSVIALALIFYYFFSLRTPSVVTSRYMQAGEALIRKRDYLGLLAISHRHSEAVARVMQRTLDFLTKTPGATFEEAREVAQTEGIRQASALNQKIAYLSDIGAIAPMLGLLGTVMGMIQSFSVLANDMAATRPMMLAEGVAEALVTTATGLVIGIPAMAAYAYFRGRVQTMIAELEAATTHLIALIGTNHKQKD